MAKKQKEQNTEKQSILTMDVADLFKKKENTVKRSKKGMVSESKRTMNFVRHESNFKLVNVLPVIILVGIALPFVLKLGFMDPLAEKTTAYANMAAKQEQLVAIQSRLGNYEELSKQYSRYSYGLMNDTEVNLVNRMDVLNLLEKEIASKASIESFAVNNNVMTMNIYGVTLEQASTIVNRLESNPLVTRATVNSATASDGVEARIFISITLTKEVKEAE